MRSANFSIHIPLVLLLLILDFNTVKADVEPGKWWQKPFGMLQTNLREIDGDMDVGQVLDFIQNHGATAWLIGVAGRKSGDLVQDALDAAHGRGIRLLARMDFSKVSGEVANDHPDWLFRSPTGDTQNHTAGLVSVCPSGEYYQERIFDILDEVTNRYRVDGFFVNWAGFNERDYFKVYHGVCHCDNCQARWREANGDLELPSGTGDATYPQWKNFSNSIVDEWTARVSAFIADRLPDAGLILGDSADIRFHEANNAVDRELWHHLTSQEVSSLISYRPDVPILVNSVAFVDMPYRMGSEEPAHYAQYFLQSISRGANPSTYIMGTPGKIPYLGLNIAGEVTSFHKKWRHIYDGMRPIAETGLVLPDDAHLNSSEYEDATSEFRGLYSAMQELHIPFDVVAQEDIAAIAKSGGLTRYNVLVLPDLGLLGSEDVKALDTWTQSGGSLISTGSSGIDEDGKPQLDSSPARQLRNTTTARELLWSTYFAPLQNGTDPNVYNGPIVPVYGSYHLFDWKEDTHGLYQMLARAPFAPPEYAYGNVQNEERGCGIGTYGDGKSIIVPFTVGRGYRELGLRVFRDFLELILRTEALVSQKIEIEIAEQIEVTINANGPKLVVHLINMSGARKQNFGSFLPIPAGTIKVQGNNVTAHALRSDRMLKVENGTIFTPGLGPFEVIVIEGWT